MADAGRVIAGTRSRATAGRAGGGDPAAGRPGQADAVRGPRADLPGAAFLDLCAGSGAAGIEALSRGAARATFVERDRRVVGTIAENLARTGLAGERARVIRAEAEAWLAGAGTTRAGAAAAAGMGPVDVVLIDPPSTPTPARSSAAARALSRGGSGPVAGSWPSTSGATPPPAESGC